jgi:hypothetical protein
MTTRHEAIIKSLVVVVGAHTATVMRETELPVRCPDEGVINIVPQDPEATGYQLGTGVREWTRPVQIELIVKHENSASRNALLDDASASLGALLHGNQLGGLISYLQLGPPGDVDVIPMEGAATLKGAVVEIALFYETSDNPMEIQT